MAMRTLIGVCAIGAVTGCGVPHPVAQATAMMEREAGPPQPMFICPDGTTNCTQTNGAGVYTAEDGRVGIGPSRLMITHFINDSGSRVTFQGRFFDGRLWRQLATPGVVYAAAYAPGRGTAGTTGNIWSVRSVRESSTEPTWSLFDPESGLTSEVTGAQLADLTVFIQFSVPDRNGGNVLNQNPPPSYALEFDTPSATSAAAGKPLVSTYNLRWRDLGDTNTQPQQYCADANGAADPVVFQQGMDVDPVTGAVARDATTAGFVTMSCRLGALATVYSWGYPYRPPADAFYFDAGIPMKRASYCADSQYYTVAGTHIHIQDDQRIQDEPIGRLEARWTPRGAMCLDPGNARHPEIVSRKGFRGVCNGQPLPPCGDAPGPRYLADGPNS